MILGGYTIQYIVDNYHPWAGKPHNAMGQILLLILDAGNGSKVPRLWMEHFPAH